MESDALVVAAWKDQTIREWPPDAQEQIAANYASRLDWLSACEALMVERGLGAEYSQALWDEMRAPGLTWSIDAVAKIRTAPLAVVVRALAIAARWHQTEESK